MSSNWHTLAVIAIFKQRLLYLKDLSMNIPTYFISFVNDMIEPGSRILEWVC